jgi:hypothetical protein
MDTHLAQPEKVRSTTVIIQIHCRVRRYGYIFEPHETRSKSTSAISVVKVCSRVVWVDKPFENQIIENFGPIRKRPSHGQEICIVEH